MEEPYYDVNQSAWYEENGVSETYDSDEDLSEEVEEDEHFFVEWAGYI